MKEFLIRVGAPQRAIKKYISAILGALAVGRDTADPELEPELLTVYQHKNS